MKVILEQEFTAIVKSEMQSRDWSLRELARQTGIAHANLSKYLTGKTAPGADQMERILSVFNLVPHLSVTRSEKILEHVA